jgi:LPS-assembly protein
VVYVRSVPVFALPWLYLPLAERRSGLLIPSPRTNSLNGFSLEQPIFLTLGRSYDITFTPGYYTGGGDEAHKVWDETRPEGPGEVEIREPRFNGVKGPRLLTEFRYTPSETMRGRATLGLLHDSRPRIDPRTYQFFRQRVDGRQIAARVDEPRGLRGEASWQHTQELGDGWYDRVDASFVSDGNYTRDLTADIIAQAFQYLRSTGTVYRRQDDFYAGLDVALRQDIRWPYRFFQDNRVPAAADPARLDLKGPSTFQRLPAITLSLPERPLAGGLTGSLRMEYVRLAPMTGGFGDEGTDGIFRNTGDYIPFGDEGWPYPLDETQANGVFDSRDREARDRVDFFPRLSTSVGLGTYARLTPSLALRQDVWAGERSGRTWQRGYPLAGLVLDTQLVRTWAGRESTAYRHALAPSLELRYVPGGWGRVPGPGAQPPGEGVAQPYDEVDAAVPLRPDGRTRGFLHAVLAVDQTLRFKRGNEAREPLRLRIGQGFDLTPYAPAAGKGTDTGPVLRDTFARLSASAGVLNAGGLIRFEPSSGRITQVGADFSVDNGKGTALYARYDDLLVTSPEAIGRGVNPLSVGPDATRRGLDTLVGSASLDVPGLTTTERAQTLIAGTRLRLGFGLGVRYEAIVQPLFLNPDTQESQPLAQQVLGLSYGPACDCWRFEAVVTLRRGAKLEFSGASLSVAGFGSFGSGG